MTQNTAHTDDKPADQQASEDEALPLAAFETSVAELETLVESLETGDISLEDALAKFERGVTLARQCQSMLQHAELRVDQLLGNGDSERIAPLDAAGETEDS